MAAFFLVLPMPTSGGSSLKLTVWVPGWLSWLSFHFDSGHDLTSRFMIQALHKGSVLAAQSLEPALGSVSLSLFPSPASALSLSLSLSLKTK